MFIWSFDPIFRFIEDSLIANGDRGKRARFNLAIAEDLTNRKALWEENYEVLEEFSSSEGLWPARNSDRYEPSLCAGACGITSCSRRGRFRGGSASERRLWQNVGRRHGVTFG